MSDTKQREKYNTLEIIRNEEQDVTPLNYTPDKQTRTSAITKHSLIVTTTAHKKHINSWSGNT